MTDPQLTPPQGPDPKPAAEIEKAAMRPQQLADGTLPDAKASGFTQSEARAVIDKELRFLLSLTRNTWLAANPAQLKLSIQDLAAASEIEYSYALDAVARLSPHYDKILEALANSENSASSNAADPIREIIKVTNANLMLLDQTRLQLKQVQHDYPMANNIVDLIGDGSSVAKSLRALAQYFPDGVPKTKAEFDWIEADKSDLWRLFSGIEQIGVIEELEHQITAIKSLVEDGLLRAKESLKLDLREYAEKQSAQRSQAGEQIIANANTNFGRWQKAFYGEWNPTITENDFSALNDEQRSRYVAAAVAEFHTTGMLSFRLRARMRADMSRLLTLDLQSLPSLDGILGRLIEGSRILSKRDRRTISDKLLKIGRGRSAEEAAAAVLDPSAREALLEKIKTRDSSYRMIRIVEGDYAANTENESLTQETEEALNELRH